MCLESTAALTIAQYMATALCGALGFAVAVTTGKDFILKWNKRLGPFAIPNSFPSNPLSLLCRRGSQFSDTNNQ